MADTLLQRSIRWLVEQQRERLAALDPLGDLGPFKRTLANVREVADPSPAMLEAAALLEAEIREREAMQARAERVVSDERTIPG